MNLPEPIFVCDQAALALCAAKCSAVDAVAVDTEFVRTDTFFPQLGLIQLSDGDRVWLVDPLAVDDLSPLKALLEDSGTVKVFHSCSEDLEVLRYEVGVTPQPMFDTQIAAAFLGYGFSRGYSALVEAVLDVQLDKHETRSDWLQRPLSASQMRYAAEDVFYLLKVYRVLKAGLESKGRMAWMAEEMAELEAQAASQDDLDSYYLRVKGAWKLSVQELAALRALTVWREQEARQRDRPRNRVVPDKAFLEMLRLKPRTVNGLYSIEGFNKGLIRRYGEQIMEIVETAHDAGGIELIPGPLDKPGRALLARCRAVLDAKAEALGVAPELLARKKDLEPLINSAMAGDLSLPDRLASGWRYDLFGQELCDKIAAGDSSDG